VTGTGLMVNGDNYDSAGDVTADGVNSYLYDGEGRICAVNSRFGGLTGYAYDAEGNRVAKGSISSWSCNLASNGFTPTEQYVVGLDGQQLTVNEVSGGTVSWGHTNVVALGRVLATYSGSDTYFTFSDWLGTKRATTSVGGCLNVWSSLPYGDGLSSPAGNCPEFDALHFTGKERDSESGLDYFGARYYGSSMGRFQSPDNGTDQDSSNPQSWNLYSYVRNNPLINTDPTGNDCIYLNSDNSYNHTVSGDCTSDTDSGYYVDGHVSTIYTTTGTAQGAVTGYSGTSYDNGNLMTGSFASSLPYGPLEGPANLAAANMIGNGGMAAIKDFAIGSVVVGGSLGLAGVPTALLGSAEAAPIVTEEATVLARASSAVGNQGAKVASREVAESIAKKFVGEGGRPLLDRTTGKVIGEISADGTKVVRWTSIDKAEPYINMENKLTGGNLHVGW